MLLSRSFRPDVIYVEPTSRTTCRGGLHVSVGYPGRWIERDLDLYHFELLFPALRRAAVVQFGGWGDPLLHPSILEMVRLAKTAGKYVAITTSGEPLDADMAGELAALGVDSVSLAVAGLDERDNLARRGTSLNAAAEAARLIHRARMKAEADRPRLNLNYTLAAQGMADLPRLPDFAASVHASSLTIGALSFSFSMENEAQTMVPESEEEFGRLARELVGPVRRLAELGIPVNCFAVYGGIQGLNCPDAPCESMFVRSDGGISPCAFTGLPIEGEAAYYFRKRPRPYPREDYGLIREQEIRRILANPQWRHFRREFASGMPPAPCAGCWRPFMVGL